MEKTHHFDFLVIGGGIAGLTFALEVAQKGTVAVLFKKEFESSSTNWAQGGIAAVQSADDNFALHIKDTEIAGAGLCNHKVVELVVKEGPERIRELVERGAHFDKLSDDTGFHLHQEGGHSRRRILHAADATGHEIQVALLKACRANKNIQFFSPANAIDLITTYKLGKDRSKPNRVIGAYVLLKDDVIAPFLAEHTMLATGGAGKVYLYTSNPDVSTGDGIAMAYRAGCRVANMEFIQFHPTCLYHPVAKSFLITEAMRGEGAILKGLDGKPFMAPVHPQKDLAPRDIVARAIDSEMKRHGWDHVWLDITHKDPNFLREHFPNIHARCLSLGIDITRDKIPVVPAAHYLCGGVVSDENGRTDIKNLYVAGECACTGLHGANRLASNSLLEGVVFGHRAAVDALKNFKGKSLKAVEVLAWNPGSARDSDEEVIITQNWDEIRRLMWNYVGIVRTDKRLERALRRLELIEHEIQEYYWNFHITSDLLELRNLCLVAKFVVQCAMLRKESRGLHYTTDHPKTDERMLKDSILTP